MKPKAAQPPALSAFPPPPPVSDTESAEDEEAVAFEARKAYQFKLIMTGRVRVVA
jgi:hypothetical protein